LILETTEENAVIATQVLEMQNGNTTTQNLTFYEEKTSQVTHVTMAP